MIRERITDGMRASQREELRDLNQSIHDPEEHVARINRQIIKLKSSRNDLLNAMSERISDEQIANVLTAVAVGQGVIDDADPRWLGDSELDSNGTA